MPAAKKPAAKKPAAEQPAPKPAAAKRVARTTSRPRLDAIIRHIKAGSYDDDMSQLQGAIADRQRVRQQAVLGLVKEVFGEEYQVAPPTPPSPVVEIPSVAQRTLLPISDDEKSEWEAAAARAEAEEQARADALGGDELPGDGYESRSPLIGSIEMPTEAQEAPTPEPAEEEPVEEQEKPAPKPKPAAQKVNPFLNR